MTTNTTTPGLSEPERRLLRRRFDATRRDLHAVLDERQRLQDELALAQQQEGDAVAAHQQAGAAAAAALWQPGATAARAQADRTEGALRNAIDRRVQAEQALAPSPFSDDVRLGRVVPVGPRIASLRGTLAALAAVLEEPLAPEETAPPPPEPPAPAPYTLGPSGLPPAPDPPMAPLRGRLDALRDRLAHAPPTTTIEETTR